MVDASEGSTQPPARRGKLVFVALAAVVALLFAGVVVGGWWLGNRLLGADAPEAGGPVPGQLRGTFPERPNVGWTLHADEVSKGKHFVRPDSASLQHYRTGFSWTNDMETGETLPQSGYPVSGRPVCATHSIGHELPCIVRSYGDHLYQLWFFDLGDGSVVRTLDLRGDYKHVEVDGEDVFLFGDRAMARGNLTDPFAHWQHDYTIDPKCPGSGAMDEFGVADHLVWSGSTHALIVVDRDTGQRVIDDQVQDLNVFPWQGFTAMACTSKLGRQLLVYGEDGKPVRNVALPDAELGGFPPIFPQSPFTTDPRLATSGGKSPYVVGPTAYDFATGEPLWSAADGALPSLIIGDAILSRSSHLDEPLSAFDVHTGQQLWQGAEGHVQLSDGQRVLVLDDTNLSAINLATGNVEWMLPADQL